MAEKLTKARIMSIDALRGFDMFWITGGDSFFIALFILIGTPLTNSLAVQLDHPAWSGFRFYDLIFPLFLFIMGLSLPFSITKRLERGDSKKELYLHIIKRTVILYILGMVTNGLLGLQFESLRYTGVLHRIAITYFFASIILMNFKLHGQIIVLIALTFGYWLVLLLIPVPGIGAYNLTPEGNLCAFIDQHLLPGSFCCYNFGDNEGILSTIPAIASVLAGVFAGNKLISTDSNSSKIKLFVVSGVLLIAVALIWNTIYPINKYLWTGSYVALTCGLSLLLLVLFYWIIDVKGYKKWAFPFVVIGMNSITIYVIQAVFDFGIIAKIFIQGFYTQLGNSQTFIYALCIILIKWAFLYFLFKQKIFLKV